MDDLLLRIHLQALARGRPPGYLHLLNRLITSSHDLNSGACPLLMANAPPCGLVPPLFFIPCPVQAIMTQPIIIRGRAMELAAWEPGVHPQEGVWFPCMDAWLVLRRQQRLRVDLPFPFPNLPWTQG